MWILKKKAKGKSKHKPKREDELISEFGKSILNKQFRFSDWFAEKVIRSVAFFSIAFVVLIFLFVFRETLPMFHGKQEQTVNIENTFNSNELKPESYSSENITTGNATLKPETYGVEVSGEPVNSLEYVHNENVKAEKPLKTLLSNDWQPVSDKPRFGLLPLFIGTLKVTIIAILFAAPLAILAALYTAMFASRRVKEIIKPLIELMAGLPSVVIGFFALMVLATFFQNVFGYSGRLNAFVGGIAMGLAAIPIIYTLTEDALSSVPKTYIEASLGLGASMRQTAFSVVLPAAIPGVFASILLGIGRVFGETMIALMATGNAALISVNPFDSIRTLSATIGAEMAEVVFGDTHYSVLFLIGSILFIFSFGLNAVAEFYLKNKIVKRIQGK